MQSSCTNHAPEIFAQTFRTKDGMYCALCDGSQRRKTMNLGVIICEECKEEVIKKSWNQKRCYGCSISLKNKQL